MNKISIILTLVIIGCSNHDMELVSNNQLLNSQIKSQTLRIEKTAASLGYTKLALTYVEKSNSVNKYFDSLYTTEVSAVKENRLKIQQLIQQHTIYKELISDLYIVDQVEPHLINHNDSTIIFIKCGLKGILPLVHVTSDGFDESINFQSPMVGKIPTKYLTDENMQVLLHSPHASKNMSWNLKKYIHSNE
ncbi:hypothetical protein QQ020_00435 [Fulvivirgaceae bacterium BMA12]|uniref:Lipoprotein n=1 Tax=Agaribacillus aureus TaxID=3051825 RepID=A0ABT8L0A7_9BACT|nr:hypothetical protein [Fulvivirgaceae bacterium BMA12]